jgi:CspA family cold shock protein
VEQILEARFVDAPSGRGWRSAFLRFRPVHCRVSGERAAAKEVFFWRAAMPEGKIKKIVADKGFGFIATGRDDLFFHHSELRGIQIEELAEGQTVSYEVGEGKKGPCAVSVQAN